MVAGQAPRAAGAGLLRSLRQIGWLSSHARIPFDILERGACPLPHHPVQREWVRLAVFGPRGEGSSHEYKHREAILEQRCAEIMRESGDLESLHFAAARALGHPAVRADPSLGGMLRAFVVQREAELQKAKKELHPEEDPQSKLARAFDETHRDPAIERERVGKAATRIRLRLAEYLAHYNVEAAKRAFKELKNLFRAHPAHVKAADVYKAESQVTRLCDRLGEFRDELRNLTEEGTTAARDGQSERALWIARRLAAVNTLLPEVLPEESYQEMNRAITQGVEQYESQQVAGQILAQEQAVAAEIKQLSGIIQRFATIEKTVDKSSDVYRHAKETYERAVRDIMSRDKDWLASLMMKLDSLLEDLRDPEGTAGAQVDQFLNRVSQRLTQMRLTIQANQPRPASRGPNAGEG
jgi:hypothetical protein